MADIHNIINVLKSKYMPCIDDSCTYDEDQIYDETLDYILLRMGKGEIICVPGGEYNRVIDVEDVLRELGVFKKQGHLKVRALRAAYILAIIHLYKISIDGESIRILVMEGTSEFSEDD